MSDSYPECDFESSDELEDDNGDMDALGSILLWDEEEVVSTTNNTNTTAQHEQKSNNNSNNRSGMNNNAAPQPAAATAAPQAIPQAPATAQMDPNAFLAQFAAELAAKGGAAAAAAATSNCGTNATQNMWPMNPFFPQQPQQQQPFAYPNAGMTSPQPPLTKSDSAQGYYNAQNAIQYNANPAAICQQQQQPQQAMFPPQHPAMLNLNQFGFLMQQQQQQQQAQQQQQPAQAPAQPYGAIPPNIAANQAAFFQRFSQMQQQQQQPFMGTPPPSFPAEMQQQQQQPQQPQPQPQPQQPQPQGNQVFRNMNMSSSSTQAAAPASMPVSSQPPYQPQQPIQMQQQPVPSKPSPATTTPKKQSRKRPTQSQASRSNPSQSQPTQTLPSESQNHTIVSCESENDIEHHHHVSSLSTELHQQDKATAHRERNREHARNTRLRKKAYLQKLQVTVDELCKERDTLVSERADAALLMLEMHNKRTEVLMSFFALRNTNEKKRDLWSSILDESCFNCVMPVTPYRSFPASEVQISKCQRTIMGIDGMIADTASLHTLLNSLVDRKAHPHAKIDFRYTLITEEAVVAGNQMMARWVMTTLNATACGAKTEVSKHGMLCCKFNSLHKIIALELMFDVMAFMLQLKLSSGKDSFYVVPNTVQTCQRPFSEPMVMTLAERPYTIVQVNRKWEEMTGYKASDIVGKTNCRILQGKETDRQGVLKEFMEHVIYKRPASANLLNYTKDGEKFWNFINVYPLSTDSKITHYLGLTSHFQMVEEEG